MPGRTRVHPSGLIDPETGASIAMDDGASGELVLTHLAPGRAAAAIPHARPSRCAGTCVRPRRAEVRCISRTDGS
jgi:phenylacetate-CoA ligase